MRGVPSICNEGVKSKIVCPWYVRCMTEKTMCELNAGMEGEKDTSALIL